MEIIMEAVRLMENNQVNEAIAQLKEYLPIASDEEQFAVAELFAQWGYIQDGAIILEELHKQYPEETEIMTVLADIYIELEDDEAAINLLDKIKSDDEAYIESLIQLADLYQAQGLFEVAEQKLLEAKKLAPAESIIDFAMGELLFFTGNYKRSIIYYEKAANTSKEIAGVSLNDRLAEAYAGIGEYEQALSRYKQLDNKNADTLFKYGLTAQQADRNDIAVKAYQEVLEHDPDYHSVYYQLAHAYEHEEMIEKAYNIVKDGLRIDEFNKELYFYGGSLAHQLDKNEESEHMVRQAIALDPDYKEAVLFLIEIFKQEANYPGIIDLIQAISQTGASDPLYEWELAKAYEKNESYNNALNHYRKAYNSLNKDTGFLKEYAYFLTEEGRIPEACKVFREYLTLQPEDIEVEAFYNRLNHDQM